MKLVQSIMTKIHAIQQGRKITVKGLMLHSVGCPQPNASVFIKIGIRHLMEQPAYTALLTEMMVRVYQTLPVELAGGGIAHQVKTGSGNNTHIGVDM